MAAQSLENNPWFHGRISRNAAEYLLHNGIDGSFLVRESESTLGDHSISVRFEGRVGLYLAVGKILSLLKLTHFFHRQVYHYRVNKLTTGGYFIAKDSVFSSLRDLVTSLGNNSDGLMFSPFCLLFTKLNFNRPHLLSAVSCIKSQCRNIWGVSRG